MSRTALRFTPRKGAGYVAGSVIAAALAVLTMDGDTATDISHAPAVECQSLTWDDSYPGMAELWSQYMDRGWVGSATDGTDDVIFSPVCFALPA